MWKTLGLIVSTLLVSSVSVAQTSAPSWVDRFKLNGDLRFRHEYTSKTKEVDTADRHQERLRARLGLQAQVNPDITAKVRLTTSDGASPLSGNSTMTDNASKKPVYFDLAMVEWKLSESLKVNLGKQENVFRVLPASQLIYDSDYTPEGAALEYADKDSGLMMKLGGFSLFERGQKTDGSSGADTWLLAGLVGSDIEMSSNMKLFVGAGYHAFTGLKNHGTGATGFGAQGNSQVGSQYVHNYEVGELLAELKYQGSGFALSTYADFLNNFAANKDNRALLVGATYKHLNEQGKPTLSLTYNFITIAKDATVSAVNNSDFANGIDGGNGHMLAVNRPMGENTTVGLAWYRAEVADVTSGKTFETNKGLADVAFSF